MNELIIKTNELTMPQIKWNKNEVETAVTELVNKYDGLEFDETQLKVAKKDLASIRKVKRNLNGEKKKVKKAWNENYTEFENDIKNYMGQIDNVINDIDEQVKSYEQSLKDERKAEITFYKEWNDIESHTSFDDTWLFKKWESKDDVKLKELFVEMKEEIDRGNKIIKQTATSNNVNPDLYFEKFKTLPLDEVVELIIETAANQVVNETEEVKPVKIDTTEEVLTLKRTLKGTKSQLVALKEYADKIGVEVLK